MRETKQTDFSSVLCSAARAAEIPEAEDIYGGLIGGWEVKVLDHLPDGSIRIGDGEVYFGRVLEGRAVQDVWIVPRPSRRSAAQERAGNRYGTTLRVWDARLGAWRITWINPVSGTRDELVGRRAGEEIVQIGAHADGSAIRWRFVEITPDSFRWLGEVLEADGRTWRLEDEFRARRLT